MRTMNDQKKEKKEMERKKSYGMLIIGAVLLIAGILFAVYAYNTSYQESVALGAQLSELKAQANAEGGNCRSRRLAQAGRLTALCYIGFAFFKIDIPAGTEKASFHFGNVFCVLAALLLGGYWGGLAGAVGMTIGDLTTTYVTSAPKTFLLKLCIGLIVGLVAHKIFRLCRSHSPKYVTGVTVLAAVCGMGFNVVADPLVGYFYKTYLFGVPQDITSILVKISALTTSVNAVVAVIAASVIYLALRPALRKAGLFVEI